MPRPAMMLLLAFTVMSLTSLATLAADPATTQPATHPSAPMPLIGMWHEPGMEVPGRRDDEPRKLIIGVWSDGTIAWSEGEAGRPYRTATLEVARLEKLAKNLEAIGFFTDEQVNHHRNRYPPDAGHTVIAAEFNGQAQRLALWRNPPPDRFGEVWTAARKLLEEARPAEGTPRQAIDERIYRLGRGIR